MLVLRPRLGRKRPANNFASDARPEIPSTLEASQGLIVTETLSGSADVDLLFDLAVRTLYRNHDKGFIALH